jgi:hypothetical protein
MLSIKIMGLPGFLGAKRGILIPYVLIRRRTPFTVLQDTAFEIETPANKRRKHTVPIGKSHGDSFRVEL